MHLHLRKQSANGSLLRSEVGGECSGTVSTETFPTPQSSAWEENTRLVMMIILMQDNYLDNVDNNPSHQGEKNTRLRALSWSRGEDEDSWP